MGKRLYHLISSAVNLFFELLFPFDDKCLGCGNYSDEYLCHRCNGLIRFVDAPCYLTNEESKIEVKCYSCTYYSHAIKKLILDFKYRKDFFCLEYLSNIITKYIVNNNIEFDVITYVPAGKNTLKKRGFNQSELLAKKVATNLNKECIAMLKKNNTASEQKTLRREQRWENVKDTFSLKRNTVNKEMKILLIDDVLTTGATAYHCAKELIDSGFFEVMVLTAAKSNV